MRLVVVLLAIFCLTVLVTGQNPGSSDRPPGAGRPSERSESESNEEAADTESTETSESSSEKEEDQAGSTGRARSRPRSGTLDTSEEDIPDWLDTRQSQKSGCRAEELDPEAYGALSGVILGNGTVSDLLDYADEIPSVCLRKASGFFVPGNCTQQEVFDAICSVEGDIDKAKSLLQCLDLNTVCALLSEIISSGEDSCIDPDYILSYADWIREYSCSLRNLPTEAILLLDKNIVREELETMNTTTFISFMQSINDPVIMSGLRCDKLEVVSEVFQDKLDAFGVSLDMAFNLGGIQMDDVLNFLPYLTEDVCEDLTASMLSSVDLSEIADLPFMCGDDEDDLDEVLRDLSLESEELNESDESASFRGLRESSSEKSKRKKMRDRIEKLKNDARICDFPCGRIISKKLISGTNPIIDLENEDELEEMGNLIKCLPKEEVVKAAKPGKCAGFSSDVIPAGERDRRRLARRCRPEVDPQDMNETDVSSMGCAVVGIPRSELERIPAPAIRGALRNLKDCMEEADSDFMEGLVERLEEKLSGDDVASMGKAAARVDRKTLRELNDTDLGRSDVLQAIKEGIKDMMEKREPGAKAKAHDLAKKLELKDIADVPEMIRQVGKKDIEKQIREAGGGVQAIKELLGLGDEDSYPRTGFSVSREVAKMLLGDKKAEDLTKEDIEELKGTLINGLSGEKIKELSESSDKMEILKKLCEEGGWEGSQVEAIRDLIKDALSDYNEENPFSEFTSDNARAFVPRCLVLLGQEALSNMSDSVCVQVCTKRGQDSKLMCYADKQELQETVQTCLECLGKADSRSGDLSEDDVDAIGKALQVAPPEVIERIPSDVIKKKAKLFRMQCTDKGVRDIVRDKVQEGIDNGNIDPSDVASTAGVYVISNLPNEVRVRIRGELAEKIDSIIDDLLTPSDEEQEEELECCRSLNTDKENGVVDDEVGEAEEQVAEVVKETVENGRRRRREALPLTCADIKTMGPSAKQLSTSQIEQISPTEFYNCISTFGSIEGWTSEQGTTLLNSLKKATEVSSLCALGSNHLQDMKRMAYHLSTDQINCLDNIDENSVTILGELPSWSSEQASSFARKYMSVSNVASAGGLTSIHLTALGHFVCGLTSSSIRQISGEQYASANPAFGEILKTCSKEKLEALAAVAKQSGAYGPVHTWDASVFYELGLVTAGLDGFELRYASSEAVEGWTVAAIKHIPGSELKKLKTTHFEALSMEQKLAISKEARSMLTEEQKTIIGDGSTSTGSNNYRPGRGDTSGCSMTLPILSATVMFLLLSLQVY